MRLSFRFLCTLCLIGVFGLRISSSLELSGSSTWQTERHSGFHSTLEFRYFPDTILFQTNDFPDELVLVLQIPSGIVVDPNEWSMKKLQVSLKLQTKVMLPGK